MRWQTSQRAQLLYRYLPAQKKMVALAKSLALQSLSLVKEAKARQPQRVTGLATPPHFASQASRTMVEEITDILQHMDLFTRRFLFANKKIRNG
jgi:hypothetical protein